MFRNRTIGFQLTASFFALIFLMGTVGLVAYLGMDAMQREMMFVYGKQLPAVDFLDQADRDLQQLLVAERSLLALPTGDRRRAQLLADMAENHGQSIDRMGKYRALSSSDAEARVYDLYAAERRKWEASYAEVEELLQEGDAESVARASALSLGPAAKAFEAMRTQIDVLQGIVLENAAAAAGRADSFFSRVTYAAVAMSALAIAVALLLAWLLARSIARPVQEAARIADRIAEGDLTRELARLSERQHASREVGQLNAALARLQVGLREQVGAMQETATSLLRESAQMMSATAQLASAASEQASGIAETTATVEELKQTGKATNDTAKSIVVNAERSVEISAAGLSSVDASVSDIRRIFDQVEDIVRGIETVRTKVTEVDEIIDTVTKVADQSNLLAVNASIEAAKAEEYGRGFAVVASEVKSLAEQSSEATKKVRGTLTNIQAAIEAVVITARGGRERAEAGVVSIEKSGRMIADLGRDISGSASSARQIAIAANEQGVGLDQISQAMTSINQAAAENQRSAAQVEKGGQSLNLLAERLGKLVAQYDTEVSATARR